MMTINIQVYEALMKASEKIGAAMRKDYMAQIKRRKGQVVKGYTLSEAHRKVQEMLDKYSRGKVSDEEAMAILHDYDVIKERC